MRSKAPYSRSILRKQFARRYPSSAYHAWLAPSNAYEPARNRIETLVTRLRRCTEQLRWSEAAKLADRILRSGEITPKQRRFARHCQFLAYWYCGNPARSRQALALLEKDLRTAPQNRELQRALLVLKTDYRRAIYWLWQGQNLDRELLGQAQRQDNFTLQEDARDANLVRDYQRAAIYACALLARPYVHDWQRWNVLQDIYYAQTRLGNLERAQKAERQFEATIATMPPGWRNFPLILMQELKASLGGSRKRRADASVSFPVYQPPLGDGFWQTADPVAMGWTPDACKALKAHRTLCQKSGADACLVVYKGKILSEWYSPRYGLPMFAMSSTKSWTGLLTGMLIADGKIGSVDDPVSRYLPAWSTGIRSQVTLRHLLTMTSGLAKLESPQECNRFLANRYQYVLNMTPTYEPGTTWDYSNQAVQLLSPILEAAAGVPLQDYARQRLFEPLGMMDTHLYVMQGHALTYAEGLTSVQDFARLGLLMMNGGCWQGRQIVPESWVRDSLQPCPQNEDYGFLWWLFDDPKGFAMLGYLDTSCYCFPDRHLMVVRMQSRPYLFASRVYERAAFRLFRRMAVP